MKFCVVEITYTAPLAEIDRVLQSHRDFLQIGYDEKRLLLSGPQNPRTGGVVIARGESVEDVKAFFARDPYQVNQLANYRFIEFTPVKHQPFVADWIGATAQPGKP
ncbi:MAG: YciI family protein [Nibricoccus sp.]